MTSKHRKKYTFGLIEDITPQHKRRRAIGHNYARVVLTLTSLLFDL